MKTIKEVINCSGMNLTQFSKYFNIPYRTVQSWYEEQRRPPEYVLELLEYKLEKEGLLIKD